MRPDFVSSRADISECGTYRYTLTRLWSHVAPPLRIVMLNPSTADAFIIDPTIGRCIEFAARDGFGGILVTNLFAYRSASPDALYDAADPVGPANDHALKSVFETAAKWESPVMVGWGKHGRIMDRDKAVIALAKTAGVAMVCLGTNLNGTPKHPLYRPGATPFQPFTGDES